MLAGLAWFYSHWRPEPQFANALLWTMTLILFSASAAVLSYLVAAMNWPLWDSALAATDAWLGVKWLSWHHFAASHPGLTAFWAFSYQITLPLTALTAVVLGLSGRTARLEEFMSSLLLAAVFTILLSGLIPSLGPYSFFDEKLAQASGYHPTVLSALDLHGRSYIDVVMTLRDGSLRHLSLNGALGLITFPSFHTVMCLLMIIAMRGHKWLFPLWLALNLGTLSAVPVDGGHYVVDMLGGALMALLGLLVYHKVMRPLARSLISS